MISYSPLLVLIARAEFATMPRLPNAMYQQAHVKSRLLADELYKNDKFAINLRRLDRVAGAIKKDGTDPKHGALYDVFNNHVKSHKDHLNDLYEEALAYAILTDHSNPVNNNPGSFGNREFSLSSTLGV